MSLLSKLTDLILYSSIWVALCAACQVLLTYQLWDGPAQVDAYTVFIFAGTLALYSIHRIIGIEKVTDLEDAGGRFKIISRYYRHLKVYATIGFAGAIIAFLFLPRTVWLLLLLPLLLSAAYVFPIIKSKKRLRDVPMIKVFVLAVTWAFVTAIVPVMQIGTSTPLEYVLIFVERAAFIGAITIPFDIRDMSADRKNGVVTIPVQFGIHPSKILAAGAIVMSFIAAYGLFSLGGYTMEYFLGYLGFCALVIGLILRTTPHLQDYYFTGLLDGTMILLFGIAVIVT